MSKVVGQGVLEWLAEPHLLVESHPLGRGLADQDRHRVGLEPDPRRP